MAERSATEAGRSAARPFLAFLVYVAAVVVVSVLGGLASASGTGPDGWYAEAEKPALTPPSWVFGPVWTLLYGAMAVAGWRLWRQRGTGATATAAVRLWWFQLVLNLLWSPLFFGAELLWVALVDIVLLDLVLALLVVRAWRVDRPAGLLLAPYLAWVLFATYLNAGLALLS